MGGGLTYLLWRRAAPPPAGLRIRQLTADRGLTTTPALSPDGKLLAYGSDRGTDGNLDIWLHPLTQGARPIRLTRDSANDTDPSFSPDGGQIVFLSQRAGSGIYVIPALGGDERLVVRGGFQPRFSPDGAQIAYTTGGPSGFLADSKVFVVPASGGVSRQIAERLGWAGAPRWSRDGKLLLLTGMNGPNLRETLEYWLAPVDGSKLVRTSIRKALADAKLSVFASLDWSGSDVLAAAGAEAWVFRLDPRDGTVSETRRLMAGPAQAWWIRGKPSQFVFTSTTAALHLWKLPLHLNFGRVTGPLTPLPQDGGSQLYPSSALDGRMLAYLHSSPSGAEVRLRDNVRGSESALLARPVRPKLSPDGSRVAYSSTVPRAGEGGLYVLDAAGGEAKTLIEPSERVTVYGWSPDGEKVVFWDGSPTRFSVASWRTGRRSVLISHAKQNIHNAELSPDGNWISFDLPAATGRPVMVARIRDGKATGEPEWITVAASGRSGLRQIRNGPLAMRSRWPISTSRAAQSPAAPPHSGRPLAAINLFSAPGADREHLARRRSALAVTLT
jgi:Tol biopolymer transport system component